MFHWLSKHLKIRRNTLLRAVSSTLFSVFGYPYETLSLVVDILQEVAADELVVSFDVISLFTSIPIDMAIDIVKRKLGESDDWTKHIQDFRSFLLHNSYFIFKGTQYHRSINQTTHSQNLGRTQKHMRQFHMLKGCRIFNSENINTAFKPIKTLGHVFKRPRDRPTKKQFK